MRTDWIKRASGLFVPQPLRWSPGYPCCCGGVSCVGCTTLPDEILYETTWARYMSEPCTSCSSFDSILCSYIGEWTGEGYANTTGLFGSANWECYWKYTFSTTVCTIKELTIGLSHGVDGVRRYFSHVFWDNSSPKSAITDGGPASAITIDCPTGDDTINVSQSPGMSVDDPFCWCSSAAATLTLVYN